MRRTRSGSLMLESATAITLVALALAGVSQLLLLAGKQQRVVEARRVAQREVGNVMERLMASTEGQFDAMQNVAKISIEANAQLPAAKLTIDSPDNDDPDSRAILVKLSWRTSNGQIEQVALTAWKSRGAAQ